MSLPACSVDQRAADALAARPSHAENGSIERARTQGPSGYHLVARSNMEVGIVRMSTARLQGHHKIGGPRRSPNQRTTFFRSRTTSRSNSAAARADDLERRRRDFGRHGAARSSSARPHLGGFRFPSTATAGVARPPSVSVPNVAPGNPLGGCGRAAPAIPR
jgi:hypothetical protein